MAKKQRKVSAVDVKMAQAHDVVDVAPVTPVSKEIPAISKPVSPTATGAAYAVLAGRPSKQAVVLCFGKAGYNLSWISRSTKMGITPEALCEKFKADPTALKLEWEKVNTKA